MKYQPKAFGVIFNPVIVRGAIPEGVVVAKRWVANAVGERHISTGVVLDEQYVRNDLRRQIAPNDQFGKDEHDEGRPKERHHCLGGVPSSGKIDGAGRKPEAIQVKVRWFGTAAVAASLNVFFALCHHSDAAVVFATFNGSIQYVLIVCADSILVGRAKKAQIGSQNPGKGGWIQPDLATALVVLVAKLREALDLSFNNYRWFRGSKKGNISSITRSSAASSSSPYVVRMVLSSSGVSWA